MSENLNFQTVSLSEENTSVEIDPTEILSESITNEKIDTGETKKKRGRPKKETGSSSESYNKKEKKIDIFEQLKKDIEDNKSNLNNSVNELSKESQSPVVQEQKNVINGYMLLLIADLFFPALIKIIFKKASKDIKLQELQLTENQKNSLEPLADAVASSLLGYLDPLTLFFIVTGGTYYQNFESLKDAKSYSSSR
jgi:signal recognition particle GTPase